MSRFMSRFMSLLAVLGELWLSVVLWWWWGLVQSVSCGTKRESELAQMRRRALPALQLQQNRIRVGQGVRTPA